MNVIRSDWLHEQSSYSANAIYDWNLDGLTEYQIYELLQKMMMYSSICRASKNKDSDIAAFIINGFNGALKGWWDNYLSQEQRLEILTAVRHEHDMVYEDSVYTLIQAIILHFIGAT